MCDLTGKLYIVATPIGNSKDISPRAMEVLRNVDVIAAEDTRRSMILLNKLGIKKKLVSNHKFNEHGKASYFIRLIKSGGSVAVISDAGTPCISDPGNELIKSAIEHGIEVIGIPGCCAAVNALSISGFELRNFAFYGFFPRENAERKKLFLEIRKMKGIRTYVFYESPKRVMKTIEYLRDQAMDCKICLCNDMTKLHERIFRGTPDEIIEQLSEKGNYDKGEFVIVMELSPSFFDDGQKPLISAEALLVDAAVSRNGSWKEAIEEVLEMPGNPYSRNELYKASLRLKNIQFL